MQSSNFRKYSGHSKMKGPKKKISGASYNVGEGVSIMVCQPKTVLKPLPVVKSYNQGPIMAGMGRKKNDACAISKRENKWKYHFLGRKFFRLDTPLPYTPPLPSLFGHMGIYRGVFPMQGIGLSLIHRVVVREMGE